MSRTETTLSIPDRVVVFDYGEVLSMSQSEHDKLGILGTAGADAATFWPAYWRHRDDLDHGTVSVADYWARVATDLGLEFDPAQLQRLWAVDFRSWISVEPGSIDILDDLHHGGTRMALLSNAGFDFGGPFRHAPFARYFEQIFVSAELGLIKPDPEIYRHVARELGIEPSAMVFVDNKDVNVAGAQSIGVTGHVFTGVHELRDFLTTLSEGPAQ
ncbi:HAD family phosphatase [Pseudolysinimonas sp.]|uniref:HAD family hydrolase n=1 Tax=Pseudolysinimonas sp. TaxID=2680009 RepID=UPI00286CD8D6|nr:HAD family phosphatase [Pseudolysinimonas sp.]